MRPVNPPLSTGVRTSPRQGGRLQAPGPLASRAWTANLHMNLAGIRIDLIGLPDPLARSLHSRFKLFLTPPAPHGASDLTIRVRPSVVKGYLDVGGDGSSLTYRLETRARDGRLHVWSYAFAGWFDLDGQAGEVNLCESEIEPPERSIENFLRVALAWKASGRGGFLLHASGLVRRGLAYLFFGPSGSGKTTVTRLSPLDLLLNDDCMMISQVAGRFVARGVPFKGSDRGGARDAAAFPIAGIYRLVQARRVFAEPISAARAVAELAASVPFVSERPEGLDVVMPSIESLVRQVPVERLHFRLAPDFWSVIERDAVG